MYEKIKDILENEELTKRKLAPNTFFFLKAIMMKLRWLLRIDRSVSKIFEIQK